jgi:sirohydrochlorin ferrochelatase
MKALLLVAHGSRRQQSNDEVMALADRLKTHCGDQYGIIHGAFLELADVLIPLGIEKCVDDGATSIRVLPYFLNSGRHVVEDIPNIVNEAKKRYPNTDISIASHLGASGLMLDLVVACASESGI